MNDKYRDRAIEHAKKHHRNSLVSGLKQILENANISDEERSGAFVMAGFIADTTLRDSIIPCWNLAADKTRILDDAIWAATQCCGHEPDSLLTPLMDCWENSPDSQDGSGDSPKHWISSNLMIALKRGISHCVFEYLKSQYCTRKSLSSLIQLMLCRINEPDAVEFVIRSTAIEHQQWYNIEYARQWIPDMVSNPHDEILTTECMERLKSLWESQDTDEHIRKMAFYLWVRCVGREFIGILKAIPYNSILYRYAVIKRAEFGDITVVRDLIPILRDQSHHFRIAHNVWCSKIMEEVDRQLEILKDKIPSRYHDNCPNIYYDISELIMHIPKKDAEELLGKYWAYIGYSSRLIQTALYVGTDKCLELAKSSIDNCQDDVNLFKGLDWTFGFYVAGRHEYLTKKHFDNLLPYVKHMDELELSELADACQRRGLIEWSRKNISHLLNDENRKRYHPSDDDLIEELDSMEKDKKPVRFWIEDFDRRLDLKNRILIILGQWLSKHINLKRFEIAAKCIEIIGTREDLSILDKYELEGYSDQITGIKENTKFALYRRILT